MPVEGLKFGATKPEIDVPEQMEPMKVMAPKFNSGVRAPQGKPKPLPTLETMNKPFLNATYKNMFDPNAAARRMNARSQMLRTTPIQGF